MKIVKTKTIPQVANKGGKGRPKGFFTSPLTKKLVSLRVGECLVCDEGQNIYSARTLLSLRAKELKWSVTTRVIDGILHIYRIA